MADEQTTYPGWTVVECFEDNWGKDGCGNCHWHSLCAELAELDEGS